MTTLSKTGSALGITDDNPNPCTNGDPDTDPCYYYDYFGRYEDESAEQILGGTWSPWHVAAQSRLGPAPLSNWQGTSSTKLTDLNNVLLRFTPDKSKWSRCAVIEIFYSPQLTQGGAEKLYKRRALSLDKNGLNQLNGGNVDECTMNGTQVFTQEVLDDMDESDIEAYKLVAFPGQDPAGIDDTALIGLSFGMSWFPGYAVDVETGYRLNVTFGENSSLPLENGRDMIWNPTSNIYSGNLNEPVFGGGHYIYIFRNYINDDNGSLFDERMPGYDEGHFLYHNLDQGATERKRVYRSTTWVGNPVLKPGATLFSMENGLIPTATTLRFNVSKRYTSQLNPPFIEDQDERAPLYNFTVPSNVFSSIEENDFSSSIGIFPNPTEDQVTITIDNNEGMESILIFDIHGSKVKELRPSNMQRVRVDVSDLNPGMYFVQVESDEYRGVESMIVQ